MSRVASRAWRAALLLGILIVLLAPLYWMVAASFTPSVDIADWPPHWFPTTPTLSNYRDAFAAQGFAGYLRNSLIVSTASTALTLLVGSPASYALARLRLPGRQVLLIGILGLTMFPPLAVLLPLFSILRALGWLNTYQALVFPYTAFNLPLTIWILTTFFQEIPRELEEAAEVDGAGVMTVLSRIVLPLAGPGLASAAILVFIACWTEFLFALTFNSSDTMRTLPVGIALFGGQFVLPWGTIFAGSVIAILPLVVLVVLFQRLMITGLTRGAVKG